MGAPEAVPELISLDRIAQLLGVPISTVRHMHHRGVFGRYYKLGDHKRAPVRYVADDIRAWLETHQVGAE
jgi:hypothetical protein